LEGNAPRHFVVADAGGKVRNGRNGWFLASSLGDFDFRKGDTDDIAYEFDAVELIDCSLGLLDPFESDESVLISLLSILIFLLPSANNISINHPPRF
jgi:hypothetical protein